MIREFLVEYKNGLLASVQGFLVLHKLDVKSKEVAEAKNPSKASTSKQTVLETRRRQNLEKTTMVVAQKEIHKKVSTIQRVFCPRTSSLSSYLVFEAARTRPNSTKTRTTTRTKDENEFPALCAAINILSVFFVLALTSLIDLLKYSFLSAFLKYFGSLLLLPIFLIVRFLSTLWFADIASSALKYRGISSSKIPDFSRAASDFIHAIFVELVFLVQALAIIGLEVPVLSKFFGFIYMSLLHSLYSFDYIWMSSGISMNVSRYLPCLPTF